MRHKESDLQIRCVSWFRRTYPQYACLLEHPRNEGSGHSKRDRMRQKISKAEGVQAGTADLLLHLPSVTHIYNGEIQEEAITYFGLAIEMKTPRGRQSEEQKIFQRYFEAAYGCYEIVRSFEDFERVINNYMDNVPGFIKCNLQDTYDQIERERQEAARTELQNIINKQQ